MTRLFVAVEMPDEVKSQLQALCFGVEGARWVQERQFHLTLAFLGELSGPLEQRVREGLNGVRADPVELSLAGLGHFPPRGAPRVLWAGVEPAAVLDQLHGRVHSCLRRLGVTAAVRRFAPHVTLARLRRPPLNSVLRFLDDHVRFRTEPFPVSDFQLFSSVLGRQGAKYRVEASYPLFGRGAGDG